MPFRRAPSCATPPQLVRKVPQVSPRVCGMFTMQFIRSTAVRQFVPVESGLDNGGEIRLNHDACVSCAEDRLPEGPTREQEARNQPSQVRAGAWTAHIRYLVELGTTQSCGQTHHGRGPNWSTAVTI